MRFALVGRTRRILAYLAMLLLTFACALGQQEARSADMAVAPEAAPAPAVPSPRSEYGYQFADDPLNEVSAPGKRDGGSMAGNAMGSLPTPSASPKDATGPKTGDASASSTTDPSAAVSQHPSLLIYDATLTLAVFEVAKVMDQIEDLVRTQHGYLVHRSAQNIKFRVPADEFNATLALVARQGDELERTVDVRDVTEEYADIQARLHALQLVRERLEGLLSRAASTEDALAVERELQRVTSELESMQGRLKVLTELVRFSTITVLFQARPVDNVGQEHPLPFPWLQELGLPDLLNL